MARCEDFPCCGHSLEEGCPNPELVEQGYFPYPCVECGAPIKHGTEYASAPSFHHNCAARAISRDEYGDDYDEYDDDYTY